jgi:genome maintenance exonuclease 1
VDNISKVIDGQIKIIDYKNSRRPKREEWVIDYYLQAAAYFLAYWDMKGIKANGAEIWIANEDDNLPQKFTLTQPDLEFYVKEFIKRRNMFKDKHNI